MTYFVYSEHKTFEGADQALAAYMETGIIIIGESERPYVEKTWRPMLEWANMTIGGQAINLLWGERDETLRRIIPILLDDPRQTKAIYVG